MTTSLADLIAPEIPFLRRYARALTGTQDSGDAYVIATLEAISEDPSIFPSDQPSRTALFKVFLRIWDGVGINHKSAGSSSEDEPSGNERTLQSLSAKPRQALLLTALERFGVPDAATAMGITTDEFNELLDQAQTEISKQVRTRVLIIEDEMMIATDLAYLVKSLGHSVTGIARTRDEAVKLASSNRPGLVLSDIHLADGSSGLDAVRDLTQSIEMPVIFITAYPERLLTGKAGEPAFLITKPYEEETVKAVIGQVLFFNKAEQSISA